MNEGFGKVIAELESEREKAFFFCPERYCGISVKAFVPAANIGNRLKAQETLDSNKSSVIFSLRHIQPGNFCFSKLKKEQKHHFADAIYNRRDFTWEDFHLNRKEKLGSESIPLSQMNIGNTPSCLTDDVQKVIVIRFLGGKGRIAGFKESNIFFILWIDCQFKLYNH